MNYQIGFYAAIHKQYLDEVELYIQKYTAQYIITCECSEDSHIATEGWHMHFLVTLTDQVYRNLIHILKTKFALQGKTVKNAAHGYGRVRGELRDISRYITYMFKDQTDWNHKLVRFKDYDLNYLQQQAAASFPKIEKINLIAEVMQYLETEYTPEFEVIQEVMVVIDAPRTVRRLILQYFRLFKKKAPSRSSVNGILVHYFLIHSPGLMEIQEVDRQFYN